MDYVRLFFIRYFILLCISAVLLITSIQKYDHHKRISLCIILIDALVIFLSVANILEEYGKNTANIPLTTTFAYLGYVLRPACLYLFIIMSGIKLNKVTGIISIIPLIINFIIFTLAFVPGVKEYIYYFYVNDIGGLSFGGGYLRFASHIISLGYLIWLLYISIGQLQVKHFTQSLAILVCALFVVTAVIIETFANENGDVILLNSTIAVSAMQYYLFLYTERTSVDALTGLFNRTTYYHDIKKMNKSINGVAQFDMNGLKYINDNYGHTEGDKALETIANLLSKCSKNNMYLYRVGGDEFVLLAINAEEVDIVETIENFQKRLSDTTYYCSVGYSFKGDRDISIDDLLKEAEAKMYQAKNEFYKNSPFERRKS